MMRDLYGYLHLSFVTGDGQLRYANNVGSWSVVTLASDRIQLSRQPQKVSQ